MSAMQDTEISKFLKENQIGLTVLEARKIQDEILNRPPTMTELVVWGIQGSEHSSYKSSKKYLKNLLTTGENVILGPSEDSGIIKFCEAGGKTFGLVLSHESHNHPSQVVPYEGAATGVGGIVRDVACMGSKVLGCVDMLRFGDINRNETKLIAEGVINGISGYGNPLGVPNMGGDCFFHPSFNENCLVNVGCVGLIEADKILHSYVPADAKNEDYEFILVGKPTDRSGFGGASFASAVLDEKDKEQNKGAVQEPNPFLERHLLASFYDLFKLLDEQNVLHKIGFKDLGAGGVLCATVELAESGGFGAEIFVENIHTGEDNLPPAVVLCSETQERFCFAVPKTMSQLFLDHFNNKWDMPNVSAGAKASIVGHVRQDGIYRATFHGEMVAEAKASSITEGLTVDRPFKEPVKNLQEIEIDFSVINYEELLKELLARENLCSRERIYENYDQTVQGNTVLERSQAECAICAPLRDQKGLTDQEKKNAFAVGVGGNSLMSAISPYWGGVYSVLTAIQKASAVGAKTVGLTDCLCYGSPEIPEEMWEFVEGIRGISEISKNFTIPFVSGNVSLYNRGTKGSVNPTVTICAFAVMDNADNAKKNSFQKEGNAIYLIGERPMELAGSEFASHFEQLGANPPKIDFNKAQKLTDFVLEANSLLKSSAVIAEGGLLITLAKMAVRSETGFDLDLSELAPAQLFSEFNGFVVEIENTEAFEKLAQKNGIKISKLGQVANNLKAKMPDEKELNLNTEEAHKIWKNALRKKLG